MNQTRRDRLAEVANRLLDISAEIEAIRDEEQAYLEAMPESLQDSEKGQRASERVDQLDEAFEDVASAASFCESASS